MNRQPKIVIDCDIPYIRGVLEPYAEVVYCSGTKISPSIVRDADALLIRTRTHCNSALLEGSSVSLIATATICFDHIDTEYCPHRGIEVVTSSGCNARGVLQWVAASLVRLCAHLDKSPEQLTLGVVGVGHVGSKVAHYARQWGFGVVECDPPRAQREGGNFRPLEEVARLCDIITFHTPLDQSTHHLANELFFGSLRPHCALLNSSRGAVVDTRALLGWGGCYGLDVWEGEPAIEPSALQHALIATPHIAGYSAQGKANATAMCVETIARRFGFPIHGWYPSEEVAAQNPRPISWEELTSTIDQYFDIEGETSLLKSAPEGFEARRNHYPYREEYF